MPAEHRLAAILFADAAGYSRLVGADEEGTHERVQAHFRELFDPKIAEHTGHVVKRMGDGLLAQFLSVVEAVRCAVEIQRSMLDRETGIPEDRRIKFRIGIHQGDIIVQDGDIFGDGVNIAARLENLAKPGGICVSARVQEDVASKLDFAFQDIGEQTLKNIARPLRAFAMSAAAIATTPIVPVTDLAWAAARTASSVPQEFVLEYMRAFQVTPFTVDATLIDKGIPITKPFTDPSGRTYTETITTDVFAFDNGTHYPVEFKNFVLHFVTGVRVTFLFFSTPDGKECFFSIYNHSERRWRRLPFNESIDLSTREERNSFATLGIVWCLMFVMTLYWFKEYQNVLTPLGLVPLGLGFFVFVMRNVLRRKRLKRRMGRLQDHVKDIPR